MSLSLLALCISVLANGATASHVSLDSVMMLQDARIKASGGRLGHITASRGLARLTELTRQTVNVKMHRLKIRNDFVAAREKRAASLLRREWSLTHAHKRMHQQEGRQRGEEKNLQTKQFFHNQCEGYNALSQVHYSAVQQALNHTAIVGPAKQFPQVKALAQQKLYIVALLHQSEKILPQFTEELVRVVLALKSEQNPDPGKNMFVSIYESGSTDDTRELLQNLSSHLDYLSVPHSIVNGDVVRSKGEDRIAFLAKLRNKALEPLLVSGGARYDQVVWLNDILYCADGLLNLLHHALPAEQGGTGVDAACGLDYDWEKKKRCHVYDSWVLHDMTGSNWYGRGLQAGAKPLQAHSCWNGMVTFKADLFQEHGLRFRKGNATDKCNASESELIFHDMWKLDRARVLVEPSAASAYEKTAFEKCARQSLPEEFKTANFTFETKMPSEISCCSLQGMDMVDFGACECHATSDEAAEVSAEGGAIHNALFSLVAEKADTDATKHEKPNKCTVPGPNVDKRARKIGQVEALAEASATP